MPDPRVDKNGWIRGVIEQNKVNFIDINAVLAMFANMSGTSLWTISRQEMKALRTGEHNCSTEYALHILFEDLLVRRKGMWNTFSNSFSPLLVGPLDSHLDGKVGDCCGERAP